MRLPAGVNWPQLLRRARRQTGGRLAIDFRGHRLRIERRAATELPAAWLSGGLSYKGATASERPNYSGMVVTDSWYAADAATSPDDG